MNSKHETEHYYIDPVDETQRTMIAYKLANGNENVEFSASLAILILAAASFTISSNKLGKRNLKNAEKFINSIPDDPIVKIMTKLICHDPSQVIVF